MLVYPSGVDRVHLDPALPLRSPAGHRRQDREHDGAGCRRTAGPARPRAPAVRPHLRPARGWVRRRHHHRLPVHRRSRRGPGRPRPHPRRSDEDRLDQGVRDPGRHAAADRPDRRRPALLLRETQEARHERAGHHRSGRAAAVGLARAARSGPRHQGRTHPRHHRRPGRSRRASAGPTRATAAPAAPYGVPYWGRWDTLSAGQQAVNRSHAKIRALVEQAMATLKTWRLLRKLRCSTTRITNLVQAVLTLHLTCSN